MINNNNSIIQNAQVPVNDMNVRGGSRFADFFGVKWVQMDLWMLKVVKMYNPNLTLTCPLSIFCSVI